MGAGNMSGWTGPLWVMILIAVLVLVSLICLAISRRGM